MTKESMSKAVPLILIVDDVETNRFVLRDIITEMGYRPVLTENGIQALKLVERHRPQLIILDVAMPEMDGYEFCRIIKQNVNTREIPIIFISAFDEPTDIVKGFNLGGEDYITKPFIPEVVKARIGIHLKLSETSRNLAEMNRKLQTSISEQLLHVELEKKNVLNTLFCVWKEMEGYDTKYTERLRYNAKLLAEAMQLSTDFGDSISDNYIEIIELAAPLCDWGKAERILDDISVNGDYNEFIRRTREIVNTQHENWNGSGVPMGRKGNEIPLAAQIIKVAREYCILTEGRGCSLAYSMEEAFQIMEQEAGIKFNPEIFSILKKIYRQLK